MTTQITHLDFDEGSGDLYEHGEDGEVNVLFQAHPECELPEFKQFGQKAALIVKAVNCHQELVSVLETIHRWYTNFPHEPLGEDVARDVATVLAKAAA